jgi:hypothetical protein
MGLFFIFFVLAFGRVDHIAAFGSRAPVAALPSRRERLRQPTGAYVTQG